MGLLLGTPWSTPNEPRTGSGEPGVNSGERHKVQMRAGTRMCEFGV